MNWTPCKDPGDIGQWITPPKCQGQIVLRSYVAEDGVVYRRTWDQSDGSREYTKRFLGDDEKFEPWNEELA